MKESKQKTTLFGKFMGGVCKVASCVYAALLTRELLSEMSEESITETSVGYADAVKAITESDLSGYYKHDLIMELRHDGDEGFYKAIITVLKDSDMSGYYKHDIIHGLCTKK